ncbi:hypothetical protein GCM10010277_01730 [Streptomyces longisporoflavus]|uniref:DUF3048 domain-containing protein n=1 Tax=Streptomyces longisporoflavus TaxID=28044 RepID=UPI00167DD4FD|nr:DUF3048 domain-containing protein [Streptomyces longisporoflavus]GGV22620.1 hypothetical protein GCM10010277_01730 [Streptomyces longisporoflavus]
MTVRAARLGPAGSGSGSRRRTRIGTTLLATLAVGALTVGATHEKAPADITAPPRDRSPFTGLAARKGPVLAVKFDNAPKARPHHGLAQADIVYVEKVEGGMSRLMGVYSGRLPGAVGPVRSARESDIELLRQFGRPALAYSGVRSSLKKELREAPLYARPFGSFPRAYFRGGGRPAPHDLFVRPKSALRTAPKASRAADIGFRFGPAPAGGTSTTARTVRYSSASHTFRWSPGERRWLASFDGAPARGASGARLGARTVVIQHVSMPPSRYKDVNGAATPYIKTVGSGRATVLRDGKAYKTRWKRSSAEGGTTFTLADGRPMPFAPGQVWMVFADR